MSTLSFHLSTLALAAFTCICCVGLQFVSGVYIKQPDAESPQTKDGIGSRVIRSALNLELNSSFSFAGNFTANEKQAILDRHNELRSLVHPEAANMMHMHWDDSLAQMAQQYAEKCIWDHGEVDVNISPFSPLGQNLWLGGGTKNRPPSGVSATNAWYNEVRRYTYDTRECSGNCGHYTQVVWAESYAIGCGRQFCNTAVEPSVPNSKNKTNVWLINCNYGPAGNYKRHPYIAGPNCTKCSPHVSQCFNALCRSCDEHNETCMCRQKCNNCGILDEDSCTCTCPNGFTGGDCSVKCVDTHRYCHHGWYPAQCSFYAPAIKGCPKMCGVCVGPEPDFVCDES